MGSSAAIHQELSRQEVFDTPARKRKVRAEFETYQHTRRGGMRRRTGRCHAFNTTTGDHEVDAEETDGPDIDDIPLSPNDSLFDDTDDETPESNDDPEPEVSSPQFDDSLTVSFGNSQIVVKTVEDACNLLGLLGNSPSAPINLVEEDRSSHCMIVDMIDRPYKLVRSNMCY